jgi:glycosyltransferase involved in cell wall biosynthesis
MLLIHKDDINRHPIVSALSKAPWINRVVHYKNAVVLKKKVDNVIATDPLSFALAFLFRSSQSRIIFISLEMYEYQTAVNNVRSFLRYIYYRTIHTFALSKADIVVFPNRYRRLFYLRKGIKFKKSPIIVENVPSSERIEKLSDENHKISNTPNFVKQHDLNKCVLYAGSLSKERKIQELINVFKDRDDILLVAGKDVEGLFRSELPHNINYIGEIDPMLTLDLLKQCKAQIGLYTTESLNTRWAAPIKVYESIVARVPIILNDELADVYGHYDCVFSLTEFGQNGIEKSQKLKKVKFDSYAELFRKKVISTI